MRGVATEAIAGVPPVFWADTFEHCYSVTQHGLIFHGWPDGGALLEQEEIIVEGFGVMKDEMRKVIKESRDKGNWRGNRG